MCYLGRLEVNDDEQLVTLNVLASFVAMKRKELAKCTFIPGLVSERGVCYERRPENVVRNAYC